MKKYTVLNFFRVLWPITRMIPKRIISQLIIGWLCQALVVDLDQNFTLIVLSYYIMVHTAFSFNISYVNLLKGSNILLFMYSIKGNRKYI